MKKVCLVLLCLSVSSSLAKKSSAIVPNNGGGGGYSQPIPYNGVGVAANQQAPQQQAYQYPQPMSGSASTQTDYYQPMDNGYVGPPYAGSQGTQQYARHQLPASTPAYYEPVPASSGQHGHYPIKRGNGWGGGHGGELGNLAFIIPFIIIPLLLCWPLFIYSAQNHHHPVVYASPGWKRSSDTKIPTIKEAKDKKIDELTNKVVPKLSKD